MQFSHLKSRVQENVLGLKNDQLRFSFWAHMLLSWVSVIIPGADEPSLWTSWCWIHQMTHLRS